ncbi:MAG TPA: metallophosphoesterase family protein, partial [Candidatus Caenarcaniphilales bacterium]
KKRKDTADNFIGVISDTHGLMRPEAKEALKGVGFILHAGDIGKPQVLEELGAIAPVVAVRGNNDKGKWAEAIPEQTVFEAGAVSIYLLHDVKELELDPVAEGFKVVISGHSHRPVIQENRGVLFVNPGSAGPRRFKLPVSLARLQLIKGRVNAQVVELPI